jgi:tRNA nucleotidyltransferase (CCA-adding enzyme)
MVTDKIKLKISEISAKSVSSVFQKRSTKYMNEITKLDWWKTFFLESERPSDVLNQLRENGAISQLPELYALIGCEQNPKWHPEGDVWNHTVNCLDEFVRHRTGQESEDLLLGFAVLCHDFGKPLSSFVDNGEIRAHGHDVKSVEPVTSFLQSLGAGDNFIQDVVALTKNHMRVFALYKANSGKNAIRRLMREVERIDLLVKLNNADECGRGMVPEDAGEAGAWLQQKVDKVREEDAKPEPLLNGSDLITLGYEPGKELGKLLKKTYAIQLQNDITDKDLLLKAFLKTQ